MSARQIQVPPASQTDVSEMVCLNLLTHQAQCFQNKPIKYFLPLCCEWMLRLWGCTRTGGITLEQTLHLSSPVTLLSSSPALPSLQPRVFPSREGVPQYLNRAFSAPRIWTVDAGYLARLVKLPAWEIRRAPTWRRENAGLYWKDKWILNFHASSAQTWGQSSAPWGCHLRFSGLTDLGKTSFCPIKKKKKNAQTRAHHFSD